MKIRLVNDGVFETVQGEGILTGMPSLFVRTAGCDLRCAKTNGRGWTCDTPLSLGDFKHKLGVFTDKPTANAYEVDVAELADRVEKLDPRYLVLTGGEPTLQGGALSYLASELEDRNCHTHTTLETNGRHFDPMLARHVDLFSLSPKVYQPEAINFGALSELYAFTGLSEHRTLQIKVVIADGADLDELALTRHIFEDARKVQREALLFIQQAADTLNSSAAERLRDTVVSSTWCREMGVRYGGQFHKAIGIL